MIKEWLPYMLIALIALQSAGAMAGVVTGDDHQSHQDGDQHLNFNHEPVENLGNVIPKKDAEPYANTEIEFDCHHCCHCHGVHLNYLPSTSPNLLLSLKSMGLSRYHYVAVDGTMSSLFRPPKV